MTIEKQLTDDEQARLSLYLFDESQRTGETPASIFGRLQTDPSALASACAYEAKTNTAQPE